MVYKIMSNYSAVVRWIKKSSNFSDPPGPILSLLAWFRITEKQADGHTNTSGENNDRSLSRGLVGPFNSLDIQQIYFISPFLLTHQARPTYVIIRIIHSNMMPL